MPRRKQTSMDRAARIAEKVERLRRVSPTTGALFDEWVDRLLAGEPIESITPEMERVLALYRKHRRG